MVQYRSLPRSQLHESKYEASPIFDRLTNPKLCNTCKVFDILFVLIIVCVAVVTGSHKERFTEDGKGKGQRQLTAHILLHGHILLWHFSPNSDIKTQAKRDAIRCPASSWRPIAKCTPTPKCVVSFCVLQFYGELSNVVVLLFVTRLRLRLCVVVL